MRLCSVWRFALGTLWCVAALGGCEEGTLERQDPAGPGDDPLAHPLTFTRGTLPAGGELPSHTVRPWVISPVADAGLSDGVDAAAPGDAATDAASHGNSGH